MAHLFNKTDFYDYRSKVYSNIKKGLETKIDYLVAETPSHNLHPMDLHEDVVVDGLNLNFNFEGELIVVPLKILEVADFSSIINMQVIQ